MIEGAGELRVGGGAVAGGWWLVAGGWGGGGGGGGGGVEWDEGCNGDLWGGGVVRYEKNLRVWNMKCGCMRASTVGCRFA